MQTIIAVAEFFVIVWLVVTTVALQNELAHQRTLLFNEQLATRSTLFTLCYELENKSSCDLLNETSGAVINPSD